MKFTHLRVAVCMLALLTSIGIYSCKRDSPKDTKLELTSFTPELGSEGGAVTLTGKNFSSTKENNTVKFNGVAAIVSEASGDGTSLTVIIPENATTGKITIKTGDQEVVSTKDFVVNPLAPVVTGFTPDHGGEGTVVTITGNNFKAPATVVIGEYPVIDIVVVNKTTITCKIDADMLSGKIKVRCNELDGFSATDFYIPPVPAEIAPAHGSEGDVVDITGKNFHTIPAENMVKFGTITAEVTEASSTKLTVKVPAGAVDGRLSVSVKGMSAETINSFTVLTTITGFNPKFGQPGTDVVISGKNFDAALTSVRLGSEGCNIVARDANSITVRLPDHAYVFGNKFSVLSRGYYVNTKDEFEVTNIWQPVHHSAGLSHLLGLSFSIGNKIYLAGGDKNSDVHEWDPATGDWTKVNTMPDGIAGGQYGSVIVANNKAYMGNFFGVTGLGEWYEFNPAFTGSGAWRKIADFPKSGAYGCVAFNLNNQLYAGMGTNNTAFIAKLDPAANNGNGEWGHNFAPSSGNRLYPSYFSINGVGYYGAGFDGSINTRGEFYKFDPATSTNSVTPIKDLPVTVAHAPGYAMNGKGYVIAGTFAYEYTPADNNWTRNKYSIQYAPLSVQVLNNKAYAVTNEGRVYQFIPNR
ncbi:MAG: IPT/TIG domain-containing protein [Pseudobacter sp.]|uniref:IPT/TIG domain-containing protein n=1 Tax=Pseudobacter sp. TaxID=2045420 RepID=UPI003F809AA9